MKKKIKLINQNKRGNINDNTIMNSERNNILTLIDSFIVKKNSYLGKKMILSYSITSHGIEFYKKILEPYEKFFPRKQI